MKDDAFYISRNYVEFGPFSAKELKLFYQRGALTSRDHVSADGTTWQTLVEWLSAVPDPAPAAKRKRPVTQPKKPASAPAPVKRRKRTPGA